MATVERVLTLARQELGYRESPPNSNRTKYGEWFKLDGYAWCMMFIMWLFDQAEASALLPVRTASCGEFMTAAKKDGNWHKKTDLKPGDIVIFDFPGNRSKTDHTGVVEEICDDGEHVVTIEGNTSADNDADGGMVMRRMRKRSLIAGAFRPEYDAEDGETRVAPDTGAEKDASASVAPKTLDDPETERMLYGGPEAAAERVPQVGDTAEFVGKSQFSGSDDDAEAVPAKACAARVEAYRPGAAHPFRLSGTGVEGWADFADVKASADG